MNVSAVGDEIKAGVLVILSTLIPATLYVLASVYLIIMLDVSIDSLLASATLLALLLLISYLLYAFNVPLIQFFKGYPLLRFRIGLLLLGRRVHEYYHCNSQIDELRHKIKKCSPKKLEVTSPTHAYEHTLLSTQLSALESRFNYDYPSRVEFLLPTKLGNVIAAFEDYPYRQYRIDGVATWPRLVPLLKEMNYYSTVLQEKAVFDFLMNTCIVSVFVGFQMLYLAVYLLNPYSALLCLMLTLAVPSALYYGLIFAARNWGTAVRVGFDLHHQDFDKRSKRDSPQLSKEAREVTQVIERWIPKQRFTSEEAYEAALAEYLEGRGIKAPEQQGVSLIDILAAHSIGIEIKLKPNRSEYDRLVGQIARHLREHENVIVLIIRPDKRDLLEEYVSLFAADSRVLFSIK